jgi:hypothetical protein
MNMIEGVPIEELSIEATPQERSGLATAALICSLVVCCPFTTIIGPILGVISLFTLKGRRGKGFAWTAIIVGLISTILWVSAGVFFGGMAFRFIEQAGEVTSTTIQAGYDGDYKVFREGLARSSVTVTDEEIVSFIDELQSRYGKFDKAVMNMEEQDQTLKPTANEAPLPIRLIFETTDVSADVLMEVISGGGFDFELKVGCIRINDSKNGGLVFPIGSECDTTVNSTSTTEIPTTETSTSDSTTSN